MSDELVVVHKSKLTTIGNSIRSRFGVSGDLTLDEMAEIVMPSLPDTYQQVDYIESSGTQYIDTGISGVSTTEFEIKISNFIKTNSATVIGSEATGRKYSALLWNNNWYMNVGSSGSQGIPYAESNEYVFSYKNGKFSVNNSEVSLTNSISSTPSTLTILARNMSGYIESGAYMSCRLYYAKIWVNGVKNRELIPCYRKSDNVIGMYDIINDVFYTNAGSGSFTCYPSPSN